MAESKWDKEVDVLVAGTGAAALTAAITAKHGGADTLIVESESVWGGTTSWSGGGLWIPDNSLAKKRGIHDSEEDALTYMNEVIGFSGRSSSPERRETYVKQAKKAIDFLGEQGVSWFLSKDYPDYYPEAPGGRAGGRALTDISDHAVNRVFISLLAELRRREKLFHEAGAKSIVQYRSTPDRTLPRLVIVIDEFAALLQEHPEFNEILGSFAQRGRSLGIHLVMATQRPAGVVAPQLAANLGLRIAFRTADAIESRLLVDSEDAALISPKQPGRAVIKRSQASQELVHMMAFETDETPAFLILHDFSAPLRNDLRQRFTQPRFTQPRPTQSPPEQHTVQHCREEPWSASLGGQAPHWHHSEASKAADAA